MQREAARGVSRYGTNSDCTHHLTFSSNALNTIAGSLRHFSHVSQFTQSPSKDLQAGPIFTASPMMLRKANSTSRLLCTTNCLPGTNRSLTSVSNNYVESSSFAIACVVKLHTPKGNTSPLVLEQTERSLNSNKATDYTNGYTAKIVQCKHSTVHSHRNREC